MARTREDYEKLLDSSPLIQAWLDTIAVAETDRVDSYNILFGNGKIEDLSKHPNQRVGYFNKRSGKREYSTAAGRFQIIAPTWNEAKSKLQLPDFDRRSQDLAALYILDKTGALDALLAGDLRRATALTGDQWASIPGSSLARKFKQATRTEKAFYGTFNTLLKQRDPNGAADHYIKMADGSTPFEQLDNGRLVHDGWNRSNTAVAMAGGGTGGMGGEVKRLPDWTINDNGEVVFPSLGGKTTRQMLQDRYARRRSAVNTVPHTPANSKRLIDAAMGRGSAVDQPVPNTEPGNDTPVNIQFGNEIPRNGANIVSPQVLPDFNPGAAPTLQRNTPTINLASAYENVIQDNPYQDTGAESYVELGDGSGIEDSDLYLLRQALLGTDTAFAQPKTFDNPLVNDMMLRMIDLA